MTLEEGRIVPMPTALTQKLTLLKQQYADALHRHQLGAIGDRTEIVRAEQLASQIETIAYDQLLRPSDAANSDIDISIPWPFAEGAAARPDTRRGERAPAEIWRAPHVRMSRTDATYERFSAQLAAWADGTGDASARKPICPSEVQNRALTEALRSFAASLPSSQPIQALVTYRDGSSGPAFPLRSVPLVAAEPDDGRGILKMTLLSIRHVEMDIKVDGAWLRNREISLPRPAGITDQIVYQQSLEQFRIISADGPMTLHLYQTGLPAAVVGFYRALIHHNQVLTNNPVSVVPFYFAGDDTYAESNAPWVIR